MSSVESEASVEGEFTPEELKILKNDPELQKLLSSAGGDFPEQSNRDSLLKLFRDILNFEDEDFNKISRAGNLKDFEVGSLAMSTRGYLSLAQFCMTENLDSVAGYLRGQSNIVFNTSLSRAAQFLKLVVTQRKFSGTIEPKRVETKSSFFGSKTIESGGDVE